MQYVYFNNKNWVNPNKDAGGKTLLPFEDF
jgi:hypothetical protein